MFNVLRLLFILFLLPFSCNLYTKHKYKPKYPKPQLVNAYPTPYSLDSIICEQNSEILQFIQNFPYSEYQICFANPSRFYMDINTTDYIKNSLKKGYVWEPHINQLIFQYALPGSTALDIGAHIGTHTFILSQAVGNTGTVFAFEPQPKIFRELFLNMALNELSNIWFYYGGVGDKMGQIELSPLVQGNEAGTGLWGGTGKFVPLITIDSLKLEKCLASATKIDVEGQENAVLDGAKETMLRERPVILIEIMGGFDADTASPENSAKDSTYYPKIREFKP